MTLCTCDASDGSPQNLEARLSASHKELKLLCKDGLRYAPDGLMSLMVCPMKAADLGKCKAVSDGAKPIDVKELLSWHPANVLWKVDATAAQDVPRVLAITEKSLPSVDRKFIVGCLKGNEDTAQCTLTVTVKAKATWRTSRTVSCAYGKESNGTPQSIILTPAERSYTLVCGADGEIVPNNYKEVFCPVGTPSSDRDPRCYDRYAAVLPGYEKKWWHEGANNSFTFAVPEDSFPDKEASISVRCRKKQQNKDPAAPLVESAASVCSLSIKVEGVGRTRFMPNISAPRTVDRFGVASGGAFFLTSLAQIL
ncbi:SAG-related sequence [Besnoitia besnoiti]|uniref:SAG-related sequence n=1 Tax=Besnoitia besnoiti TaxID=94643 RepID=A0A2A9MI09_BESBE|nr:SAG-related sequence [Besnoitia besnoiti]PFH36834.1 SAG-related sequence [Besnoitia besnoiti]